MNVLTDEEKLRVFRNKSQYAFDSDAGQIEIFDLAAEAVIKRLAAGVSVPTKFAVLHHDDGYFTTNPLRPLDRTKMRTEVFNLDQLNTAIAAARVQAMRDCEAAIKSSTKGWGNSENEVGLFAALGAIRALLGKEAQS